MVVVVVMVVGLDVDLDLVVEVHFLPGVLLLSFGNHVPKFYGTHSTGDRAQRRNGNGNGSKRNHFVQCLQTAVRSSSSRRAQGSRRSTVLSWMNSWHTALSELFDLRRLLPRAREGRGSDWGCGQTSVGRQTVDEARRDQKERRLMGSVRVEWTGVDRGPSLPHYHGRGGGKKGAAGGGVVRTQARVYHQYKSKLKLDGVASDILLTCCYCAVLLNQSPVVRLAM